MKKFLNYVANQTSNTVSEWAHLVQYMEQSPEAIFIATATFEQRYTNPSFRKLFRKTRDDFFTEPMWEKTWSTIRDAQARASQGERVTSEVTCTFGEGTHHFSITHLPAPVKASERLVIGIVKSMTDSIQLQEERVRFDAYRHIFGSIDGLALFEFNLSNNAFTTFGSLEAMFGLTETDFSNYTPQLFKQMLHPDDLNAYLADLGQLMIDPKTYTRESTVRIFHLQTAQYRSFLVKSHLSTNRKVLTFAVIDSSRSTSSDQTTIEQLSQFVEAAMMEYDFQTESFRYMSPGLFTMMGYTSELPALTPEFWRDLIHPDDLDLLLASREESLAGKADTYVYRVYVKGELVWVEERREPIVDETKRVTGYRSMFKNITRLHEQQEKITELRTVDPVTGVANRETLTEHVHTLLTNHTPVTMIGVSFNHHKEVSQTLGFEFADEWRAVTTAALQQLIPDQAMLALIGEDLNAIVIPSAWTDEEARQFGKRVTELAEQPFVIGNYEIFTTISVGVCRSPRDGKTANDLIKHTVHVTNYAFAQGAPYVELYSSKVDIPSLRRYELINDLRTAIKQREFYVVYQPKVDAWSGEIIGAEALMRWTHPRWGAVSPAEFIPLIEHNNQYVELTDFLISEVCSFLKRMAADIPISINVPVQYFYRDDYLAVLRQSIEANGLTPSLLEIEIPESTLLDNRPRMKQVFDELNAYGVRISFDDFGKGYSSLAYVQDYNVQTIKIDRVFAHGIHQNTKSQAIVRSLMFIAKEFTMHVVVEGVECFRDLAWLRDHGVTTIQGFLFSRPVSNHAFLALTEQKFLHPTEVLPVERQTELIPAHMSFSKIKTLTINLGQAPVLVAIRASGLVALYTKLYLPPDDFLRFTLALPPNQVSVAVTITNRVELANGLYCYDAVHQDETSVQQARDDTRRRFPNQTWDVARDWF
ncbi:EAL domain-containing protein [Exiguobacterium sp. s122]|uniref:sensor domain-containing protein n=3 Tax=Exiguobacterium TaxID=33986 RepID=UPI001BEC4438|nr:EAL domain-containing protein [Exiguobacterium sp. s122]